MIGDKARLLAASGVLGLGIALSACNGNDRIPRAEDIPVEMPDMPMEGRMPMDPAMMERHADEAESMAEEMREHIGEMHRLSAEEQLDRMDEHVREVSRMLSLMSRQMREMSRDIPMDDEQMGAIMGMAAEQYRHMVDEMSLLRTELEVLQAASVDELRERMAAHLDRCERVVEMMEHNAESMRQM